MNVVVKEVKSKKEFKQWIEFPNILYKDNPYYVPFLTTDEMATFSKKNNPAYDFCETKLFLAYIDKKVVGRIAGLINKAYNKKWNKNRIRFTRFDFIDNYDVSKALFDEVVKWGKEKGHEEIMGPIGFTDLDHEGMLVDGFEELNMSITFYNHPYYIDHMEKLGLEKEIDWMEYQIKVPSSVDPRLERITNRLLERNGLKIVNYDNRKVLLKEAFEAFKIIDIAFSKLYGTVPLTDKIIEKSIKDYIPIVNLDYICSVKTKEDKIIGFAVLVPSIAKALKKSNGKLLPLGVLRMLKALKGKNKVLEMFFVAVDPEYQNLGVPALMMCELIKIAIKNKVEYCETGPELETNIDVQGMWKMFETRQHKRRRCYVRKL